MSASLNEMVPGFENCFEWNPLSLHYGASNLHECEFPKGILDSPSRFLASDSVYCYDMPSQEIFLSKNSCEGEEDEERDSSALSKVTLSPGAFKSCRAKSIQENGGSKSLGRFSCEREESQLLKRSMESCYRALDKRLEEFLESEIALLMDYRGYEHFEELLPIKKLKGEGASEKVLFKHDIGQKCNSAQEKFWRKQTQLSGMVAQAQLECVKHLERAGNFRQLIKKKELHAQAFENIYKERTKKQFGIDCEQLPSCYGKNRKDSEFSLEESENKSCSTVNLKFKRSDGKISKKTAKKIQKNLEAIKGFSKEIVNRSLIDESI